MAVAAYNSEAIDSSGRNSPPDPAAPSPIRRHEWCVVALLLAFGAYQSILFFGHTPASRGDEIRAASPVNVFGKIIGDFKALNTVRNGEKITVEKIEE